jgi:hypothetical protein
MIGSLFVLFASACGDGGGGAGSTSPSSKPASSAKPAAAAKPTATATATAAMTGASLGEMVEMDLSERGAEWKGFSIKAPKEAKVMEDLGDARVAMKGFDVVISQKKNKITVAEYKKTLEGVAKQVKGKVTFENETADGFDYTMETPKFDKPEEMISVKRFYMSVKAGTSTVGCFPHDSASADEQASAREACKTIAKK